MNKGHAFTRVIISLYKVFLFLYPEPFRREYGPEMVLAFRDESYFEQSRGGTIALFHLWLALFFDLVVTAFAEHIWEVFHMPVEKFSRGSGLALIIGGLTTMLYFISELLNVSVGPGVGETVVVLGFFVGPLFIVLGILGLQSRFGPQIGKPGRAVLLAGGIGGMILVIIGDIGQVLDDGDTFFEVFAAGFTLIFLALFLFGLLALVNRPLPRWNGLPLLASGGVILWALIAIVSGYSGFPVGQLGNILGFAILSSVVGLVMLGYLLHLSWFEEPAVL